MLMGWERYDSGRASHRVSSSPQKADSLRAQPNLAGSISVFKSCTGDTLTPDLGIQQKNVGTEEADPPQL